jgi:hypothetical protein
MDNLDKNSKEIVRNEKGQLAKGVVLNPAGRPKGSGYKQKFETMLNQVAEEKGITREQAELELFKTAYDQAVKGNYQFFKDYVDRAYGPVNQNATLNVENLERLVIIAGTKDDYQE